MSISSLFYLLKPIIPRSLQVCLRRQVIKCKKKHYEDVWPIDRNACKPRDFFDGWPDKKKFALVITHDVDTKKGQEKARDLVVVEERLGFRSSFNFVPEAYEVDSALRIQLVERGFEVGVHGLKHDGKLYISKDEFLRRADRINDYLKQWGAVGFRSPAMHHNLKWLHELDIEYDSSTFDTDPFEPQPDGAGTIFPFFIKDGTGMRGYIELPYTLPQDFTLFVLMKQKNIDIWKKKVDWIAGHAGMVLMNTHPDYMHFKSSMPGNEEYPVRYYEDLLEYIKYNYKDQYWHVLPREIGRFWKKKILIEKLAF